MTLILFFLPQVQGHLNRSFPNESIAELSVETYSFMTAVADSSKATAWKSRAVEFESTEQVPVVYYWADIQLNAFG